MVDSEGYKRLSVELPSKVKEKLEKEKALTGKSIKDIIMEALELYFKKNRSKK